MSIDQFYTPPELARAIVAKLVQYGDLLPGDRVLDPCVGKGAFRDAFMAAQPSLQCVTTVDLDQELAADIHGDFTKISLSGIGLFNLISSNPPFSQWQKFVETAVGIVDPRGVVAYLLRFSALGPSVKQKRAEFLRQFPVSTADICRPRPSFYGGSDNSEYALFRWCPQDFDGLRSRGVIVGQVGTIDWAKAKRLRMPRPKKIRKPQLETTTSIEIPEQEAAQ